MRPYLETHPWISFRLDTNEFDWRLWMLLGESASKCLHIAGVPLDPKIANEMHELYLVKGALATTAIEGNTLSEDEANRIVSGELKLPPTQQYLADELNNIVDAVNDLLNRLKSNDQDRELEITPDLLREMNEMVLRDLEVEEDVIPGKTREHSVVVGRYRCPPWTDCDFLVGQLCDNLNRFQIPTEYTSQFCLLKAIFAHLYLVWIHPFGDGNGRTARLLEFFILLQAGFPQPTAHLLSNHYNKTRTKYYSALDEARDGDEGIEKFFRYSIQGFVEGLKDQIEYIRKHQWMVSWINYVHERFSEKNTPPDVRRRKLVLELSAREGSYAVNQIRGMSPETATIYGDKTRKTILRDLNELVEMDLVHRCKDGKFRAKREKILAFAVWRAVDDGPHVPLIDEAAV